MEDLFNSGKVVGLGNRVDVVGDDDIGRKVGLIDRPSFCTGSTEDEINRAHDALKRGDYSDPVFKWNPERHKDSKNPNQCETARLYDLLTDKWYRESPASLLKNLGAGIVNAIVPGSDLGDRDSSTQIVGQLVGSIAGSFVNPGAIVSKLSNSMSLGSTLTNAFNFVNKTFSGPIGAITSNVVGSLLAPAQVTPVIQAQVLSASKPANITDNAMSYQQQAVFGGVSVTPPKINTGETPWYKNPTTWLIAAAVIVPGGLLLLFMKRKRRK